MNKFQKITTIYPKIATLKLVEFLISRIYDLWGLGFKCIFGHIWGVVAFTTSNTSCGAVLSCPSSRSPKLIISRILLLRVNWKPYNNMHNGLKYFLKEHSLFLRHIRVPFMKPWMKIENTVSKTEDYKCSRWIFIPFEGSFLDKINIIQPAPSMTF